MDLNLVLYKERLELTLAGTNCGTWYHDFAANIVHYDDMAMNLLGIYTPSLAFDEWTNVIHPEDIDRVS